MLINNKRNLDCHIKTINYNQFVIANQAYVKPVYIAIQTLLQNKLN